MLTRLLAVALLAPTLTLAQDPLAPQTVPPAAPTYPANPVSPPPPAPTPYQSHSRDTWYIGFGLGTGSGNVKGQGGRCLPAGPGREAPGIRLRVWLRDTAPEERRPFL